MSSPALLCPCGVSAPAALPAAGRAPLRCAACATPLVRPGGISRDDAERALGAALLAASLLAVGWMFAARWTDGAAHWAVPVAGLLVGAIAWTTSGVRGPSIQRAAAVAFAAFVVLGEVLLFRGALLTRLVTMHAAEGAPNPELLAQQELSDTGISEYLHIELTFWLFAGVAAGLLLALRITRAPAAVEAFLAPPTADEVAVSDEAQDEEAAAWR